MVAYKRALLTGACGGALLAAFALGKVVPVFEQIAFLAALGVGLVPVARRAFAAAVSRYAVLDRNADDDRGGRRGR